MKKACDQKLGFYGGSFDPVHLGHLIIAQDALEQAGLDRVYFVPAAYSPLKNNPPEATPEQRLAMLRLALEGRESMEVIDDEIRRQGTSYTVETIEAFRQRWPQAELYWLIGADQVEQLPRWHRIDDLLEQLRFICVSRPAHRLDIPSGIPEDRLLMLKERLIPISSTEVRRHLAEGKPVDFFLPPQVTKYIHDNSLYALKA